METAVELLPRFFGWMDFAAFGLFLVAWHGMTWLVESPPPGRPSVHTIMAAHRLKWMMAMLHREPRIMDASLLNALRSGCAFFASGCMIAIGGVVALLGQADRLVTVAHDLRLDTATTRAGWEAKLLVLALVLVSAFMKFVWAHRLFGYCAVLMGTIGSDAEDPENQALARKAAAINVNAARNFNRGMRTTYFSMALLTWLLGAVPLALATLATALTLYRREFRSASRDALLAKDEPPVPDS
ncbi:DUF599 domain-containing protein [Albimonas sp. CAU 1670]|uniref:DUF599 domain-containing protein n=1 Tax=Albimonas sp. CAU 1670 TaxID=3032599 RepID=UPI0023D98607|nr:DUF599 domain-containing protein [Albimonas sp. CAU 1670]MDF2234630.1 DUF599 domain-containing protein [Albimonas sp. CAU 1670]